MRAKVRLRVRDKRKPGTMIHVVDTCCGLVGQLRSDESIIASYGWFLQNDTEEWSLVNDASSSVLADRSTV